MMPVTDIGLSTEQDIVTDLKKGVIRQLTDLGKKKIDKWFDQFSETLKAYMNLPKEAESTQWIIREDTKPQYYEQIVFLVLDSYRHDYYLNPKNIKDVRFDVIIQYLLAQGRLKRK